MLKNHKDQQYPMFSCRLAEEVQEKLKLAKSKSEKSWNLFIKDLLKTK